MACPPLYEVLAADSCQDHFRVNGLLFHLCAKDEGIRHQVIDEARIPLGMAVDGGKGGFFHNGITCSGAGKFVKDIL